jgi:hypothetical protein
MANNIIGDSFDDYVKEQILVRQSVLGLGLNDKDTVIYKNNNSAFVRLTSGVNVDTSIITSLGLAGEGYKGSGLAKQFKLFSARTQNNGTETFTNGIGYDNLSSYGFLSNSNYGYVPPPGILSAEVKAMNRGSLREANIEIQCHNLQQFQILEILYMRLKYSILLEWGHNMYYSNPTRDKNLSITQQPQLEQSTFDLSDEMLSGKYSQEGMLKLIADTRRSSYGNYDAFFGLVTNFSWTLRQDGGYNITVTARSMGDVIESLKINTSYPIKETPPNIPLSDNADIANTALQTDYYKSSLNRMLTTIVTKLYGKNYAHGIDQGNGDAYNPMHNYKLQEYSGLTAAFNRTSEQDTKKDQLQDFLTYNEAIRIIFNNLKQQAMYGTDHYYMKLGTLLRIIESFLIYYDTSKGGSGKRPPIFKIDYNYNTNHCLTFPRHASLNPTVCLIPVEESASSAGGATGLAAITTTYTYLTKTTPGEPIYDVNNQASRYPFPTYLDLVLAKAAGGEYYSGNEFGWRDVSPVETQTPIDSLPGSIPYFILNDTYVASLENIWNTPQTDDNARNTGYDFINTLRNPFLSPKGFITPTVGKKYITNIDVGIPNTNKDIIQDFPNDGAGARTYAEKNVYKATIVVTEYRDLGNNFGRATESNQGDPVYKKILKDNPFRESGFRGKMMHIMVNMEYIASTLSKYVNVETGEIALYDFLDNLMKGIQHALGNINNFEITYDEENNIHRIIDNTTIPGVLNTSKGIAEFNANILQSPRALLPDGKDNGKIGGSFIKNVNFRTKLSNNFATMTTIGAQKNGNAVGANSTMLSKWNEGLTDRVITNRENPNYDEAKSKESIDSSFVKNVIALQDLNSLVDSHTVGDYEVGALEGAVNDLFQAELGKFVQDGNIAGIGFIPFDLELTMLGLSGPRIYEAYTIDTTLLPNSYKDKLQFICSGVSHKIADGEWTTTLNSIAGPKPSSKIFNPPPVKVLKDAAQEANNANLDADKKDRIITAMNFLIGKGLGENQAAGLVGNLLAESSLKPTAIEKPGQKTGGAGIAQWTGINGGRKTRFETYMGVNNDDAVNNPTQYINGINNLPKQLEYLWSELGSDYSNVLRVLQNSSTTLDTATIEVLEKFEVPATFLNRENDPASYETTKNKRKSLAQQALDAYRNR